ncbi:hypothetical protein [Corynebacterium sp.]|uniref:hypothetical protein n=1 Tax=Corynebacterium sp. TaxID=1720 RepID=UPI002A91F706|nr:hypothetical protein [Corynebacterium sp.]MDY5786503.1 hypothetical protein [Corynebacterium sp.]
MHVTRLTAAAAAVTLPLVLSACGSVDPAASAPVTELVNAPDGFSATKDGTELSFGDSAQVVTTNYATGAPAYWEVTVHPPQPLTVREVAGNLGRDPQRIGSAPAEPIKQFTCFRVTFTSLGTGLSSRDAPVSVELPRLTPIDAAGAEANYVGAGAQHYCGIDGNVPAYTADMRQGEKYTTAVVTWEGVRDPGVVGTAVELTAELSPRNPGQPSQRLVWSQ